MYKRWRRTEPSDGSSPSGPMGSWVQRGGEEGKGKRGGETPSAGGAAAVVSLKARQGEKKEPIRDMWYVFYRWVTRSIPRSVICPHMFRRDPSLDYTTRNMGTTRVLTHSKLRLEIARIKPSMCSRSGVGLLKWNIGNLQSSTSWFCHNSGRKAATQVGTNSSIDFVFCFSMRYLWQGLTTHVKAMMMQNLEEFEGLQHWA